MFFKIKIKGGVRVTKANQNFYDENGCVIHKVLVDIVDHSRREAFLFNGGNKEEMEECYTEYSGMKFSYEEELELIEHIDSCLSCVQRAVKIQKLQDIVATFVNGLKPPPSTLPELFFLDSPNFCRPCK